MFNRKTAILVATAGIAFGTLPQCGLYPTENPSWDRISENGWEFQGVATNSETAKIWG
jgi:hypothetical protein